MEVTAMDIINSLYHPTDILNLRVFDDKKRGVFTGQKLSVEAGKFATVEKMLRDHNEQGHGIFYVSLNPTPCHSRICRQGLTAFRCRHP